MFKRTLIVISVIVLIVFVPYFSIGQKNYDSTWRTLDLKSFSISDSVHITYPSYFVFPEKSHVMIEPPSSFEIMKWTWVGFPKTHNGWAVEEKEVFYMQGLTEGIRFGIVNVTCDTCNYLKKYSFDTYLEYGYGDGTTLKVTQNKDSTEKYFKIEYPNL